MSARLTLHCLGSLQPTDSRIYASSMEVKHEGDAKLAGPSFRAVV